MFPIKIDCDRNITTKEVELTQPKYPNMYSKDLDCKQQIQFEDNEVVHLSFLNVNLVDPNMELDDNFACFE